MSNRSETRDAGDPYELRRFVSKQEGVYDGALGELAGGWKKTHWMWFIFPQIDGLGMSQTSKLYSIKSIEEAHAYLGHPVLGPRLMECAEACLRVEGRSAREIFGEIDEMKLQSCATLFASVSPAGSVFERLLDRYFHGARDGRTLELLGSAGESG